MLSTALLTCVSLLIPPIAVAICYGRDHIRALPLTIAGYWGIFGTLSALCYRWLSFGWPKWALTICSASLFTSQALRWMLDKSPPWKRFPKRITLAIAIIAIIGTLDVAALFARQGWHFLPGSPLANDTVYFRRPFNDDVYRNLIVLNGILRESDGIILPGAGIKYQTFWFHAAAVIAALKGPQANFYDVAGLTWVTAISLYFVLGCAIFLWRPSFLGRPFWLGVFSILILTNADLYNMASSLFFDGLAGIEADLSATHSGIYRYVPLKFMAILAPQHSLFFLFFVMFLASARLGLSSARRRAIAGVFFVLSFLASPLHAAFSYPAFGAYRCLSYPRRVPAELPRLFLWSLLGIVGYLIVFRTGPWQLFLRRDSGKFALLPWSGMEWWLAPLVFIPALGALGIAALLATAGRMREGHLRGLTLLASALILLVGSHYVVTSHEIRRHGAMVAFVVACFGVASALPASYRFARNRPPLSLFTGVGALALLLHAYFAFSFTAKPSVMPASIPWKDYFAMNELLRERFGESCVVGAVHIQDGVLFPLSAEAITTLSHPEHAYILAHLTEQTYRYLKQVELMRSTLPLAKELNCPLALWGPVERELAGSAVKSRFLHPDRLLARTGTVELYEIEDILRKPFGNSLP